MNRNDQSLRICMVFLVMLGLVSPLRCAAVERMPYECTLR